MLFPDPKPGDEVAYYRSYRDTPRKLTIARVTPTQIVVGGQRFRRVDGDEVGGSRWDRTRVKPWTPDIDEALAKEEAAKRAAEHLEEMRNRGRAAFTLLGTKTLDEVQTQAAEDLVLEVERRVRDILGLPSEPDDTP
jgi:hypothetical protein